MEEMLVEALFNGDKEAQIRAASELGKLSSKQRHKLAERGVIAPLILMLHSQDYETIEVALFALLSLAFGSERNKVRIAKSGAIPVLLNLLQCQIKALIELAIAALLILSSCAANKIAIASSGAIQLLIQILNEDYSNDDDNNNNNNNNNNNDNNDITNISIQAKLDTIATLHNLSTSHHIIPSMVSSSIVFALFQLIYGSEKSSELVEKTMALLEKLVSSSEIALQETAAMVGAIQALVETVEEGSLQCKEHAVGILLLICQSSRETYRSLILREGVIPGLLQLSVDGTWRAKDLARDLLLLLRDCSNFGAGSRPLKNELVEQIMEEIDTGKALRLVEEMIAKLST